MLYWFLFTNFGIRISLAKTLYVTVCLVFMSEIYTVYCMGYGSLLSGTLCNIDIATLKLMHRAFAINAKFSKNKRD